MGDRGSGAQKDSRSQTRKLNGSAAAQNSDHGEGLAAGGAGEFGGTCWGPRPWVVASWLWSSRERPGSDMIVGGLSSQRW